MKESEDRDSGGVRVVGGEGETGLQNRHKRRVERKGWAKVKREWGQSERAYEKGRGKG